MTITYKFAAFSRNVGNVDVGFNIHSGYALIMYEDDVPISMKTIEVTASSLFGNMNFANSNDVLSGYSDGWIPINNSLSTNGKIIPEKVFENGQWLETTSDWVTNREYKMVPLKDNNGNDYTDPEEVYQQIENNAGLLNQSGISYDPSSQNCNTWVGYIDRTILGGIDVFEQLNDGLENPDIYVGAGLPFPFPGADIYLPGGIGIPNAIIDYWKDKKILENVENIQAYLNSTELSYRDVSYTMYMTLNNLCCTITHQNISTNFITPLHKSEKRPLTFLENNMKTAETARSPLVIDLDGDGVETTGTERGVHFDHDGNGFAEKSGWVGKDDGLLVRDINGNGEIDDGTELFGNNSVLSSEEKAANGFEALADLDSNGDGIFNSTDTAWNEVKVWKDSNQNGSVDAGELLSLEQVGISGINLGYQNGDTVDENGNTHGQTGTFIKSDGTTGNISDVWFDVNNTNTVDKSDVEIPEAIKSLPEVAGFGNVHSLQIAMALDTGGELKTLIEQFIAETDITARDALLNNILYHWAGVQNEDPRGRDPTQIYGPVLDDCRKLEALEEFMGEDFLGTWCWGERDPNPHAQAAPYILQAFDELKNYLNLELLSQTHYKTLLENISLNWDANNNVWNANVTGAVSILQGLYNTDAASGQKVLREFAKLIKSYKDFSAPVFDAFKSAGSLEGTALEEDLFRIEGLFNLGTAGDDVLNGNDSNDLLNGDAGNDRIYGGGGDDILNGGGGDDILVGGTGTDIYRFDAGFGNDSIDNMSNDALNTDSIEFGTGIEVSRTTLERQGFDLIIRVSYADENQPADTVRIFSYFDQQGTTNATVNSIKFADGTVWNYDYIIANWNYTPGVGGGLTLEGSDNRDLIFSTEADDIVIGNDGDDEIYGQGGNDLIIGGKGNDLLFGGHGGDTYLWNLGDGLDVIWEDSGHDKIVFGEGITFSDLTFRSDSANLKIIVKDNENQGMIIRNFFGGDINRKIDDICFNDGTIFHLSEESLTLHQKDESETINVDYAGHIVYANGGDDTVYAGEGNDTIFGGAGNDSIYSGNGDDVLVGGIGNDYLEGGYGEDTYIYNLGDGFDSIKEYKYMAGEPAENKIVFGAGIAYSDITFRSEGKDLIMKLFNNEAQGIRIVNYFDSSSSQIKELHFADGSIHNLAENGLTLHQTDIDDVTGGTGYNDVIYGHGGNDSLYGNGGNDTLIGGTGNDYLEGGYGDDTYVYNLGDGFDTIVEGAPNSFTDLNDKIVFGEGISRQDLTFEIDGNNLTIKISGNETQGIKIQNQFREFCQVEKIEFYDGSSMNLTSANQLIQAMSAFSPQASAPTDVFANPTQNVNEMYNLSANSDLVRKVI